MNTHDVLGIILAIFRQAWGALTAFVVIIGALAILSHVLKSAGGAYFGAEQWASQAFIGIVSIVILVVMAFVGIPVLVRSVSLAIPSIRGCGPAAELGEFAAGLLAAIVSLRMLLSVARAVGGGLAGLPVEISRSLLEVAEALLGMLIVSLVIPLTSAFFLKIC